MSSSPYTQLLYWRGWTIRQYPTGRWDAAENNGPGLSPGFLTFSDVAEWVSVTAPSLHGWAPREGVPS